MNLGALINRLPGGLDGGLCIYAADPWLATSRAAAVHLDDAFQPPWQIVEQGLVYFLEVNIAREVLEIFGDRPPTEAEKRDLLIFYAENDAYPDWVYTR